MVWTTNYTATGTGALKDPRCAVSANIKKCTQLIRLVANDDNIVATDIRGHKVTVIRKVVDVANELPAPEEQRLVFEFE